MITAIACISGFTETDRDSTGMDQLQRAIAADYETRGNVEVYDLRPWKHDAKGFAALMKRDGISQAIVIGYSWGGGYGSPRLCRELLAVGIQVPQVLLCDPVFRPQWLPAIGPANVFCIRALIPGSAVIKFPAGVGAIDGVRQTRKSPRGHAVQIGDGKPFDLPLMTRKTLVHTNIDSSYEFRALVAEKLDALIP